ncbi:MAG: DNA cytosine methyltransferase [Bacteroidota bacterium]
MKEVLQHFRNFMSSGGRAQQNLRQYKKRIAIAGQGLLGRDLSRLQEEPEGRFQVIDFFSGSGGMSSGFFALKKLIPGSFEILGGCDINEEAAQSYSRNFGAPVAVKDIRKLLDANELNDFLKSVRYDPRRPLVVIGCAPCQGFTSHRKKDWDNRDSRNDLISVLARVATQLKPVCVVMENVPEVFSNKYEKYYQDAKGIFESVGYVVHQKVYNMASFGVPQERFRLLSVAMKKDFLLPEELFEQPEFLTVRDAIGDLPPIVPGEAYLRDAYHVSARHKPGTIEVIKAVPKNGGNRPPGIGPKCLDRVKGFTDVYGRLSWDKPSITITQYARNPASGRYVHPEQDRGLSVREAARLQSFPDEFIFVGKFDSMFKQIGEAVPPKFSCAVAASVFVELLSPPPDKEQRKMQSHYTVRPVSNSYASMVAGVKSSMNT